MILDVDLFGLTSDEMDIVLDSLHSKKSKLNLWVQQTTWKLSYIVMMSIT